MIVLDALRDALPFLPIVFIVFLGALGILMLMHGSNFAGFLEAAHYVFPDDPAYSRAAQRREFTASTLMGVGALTIAAAMTVHEALTEPGALFTALWVAGYACAITGYVLGRFNAERRAA